jgi:hypothetical protein
MSARRLPRIFLCAAMIAMGATSVLAQSTPAPAIKHPNPASSSTTDQEGINLFAYEGENSPTDGTPGRWNGGNGPPFGRAADETHRHAAARSIPPSQRQSHAARHRFGWWRHGRAATIGPQTVRRGAESLAARPLRFAGDRRLRKPGAAGLHFYWFHA